MTKRGPHIVHVCTSCRARGASGAPGVERAGSVLYRSLRRAVLDSPLSEEVQVKPTECLSVCPRPCGIAMSSPGGWTYLFGDQHPTEGVKAILDCIALYVRTSDGFMSRSQRPSTLRSGILGRVPPLPRSPEGT